MNKCQTKTQILKLAKILNQFSVDDILIMMDLEKQEIQDVLSELENDSVIKKINKTQYIYFNQRNNLKEKKMNLIKSLDLFEYNDESGEPASTRIGQRKRSNFKSAKVKELTPIELFSKADELKKYEESSPTVKKYLYKYISLINLANGLNGKDLDLFLKELAKKRPELEVTYSTFKRHQREYIKSGISGIMPKYLTKTKLSTIDPDIYKLFKKLYLHPKRLTIKKCIDIIKETEEFKHSQIPHPDCFRNFIYKDYSFEEINQRRRRTISLPDLPPVLDVDVEIPKVKKPKTITFDKYIDAINYYLESEDYKNLKETTKNSRRGYIKKHLNPFFEKLYFFEISPKTIKDFQTIKYQEGLSTASILRILSVLNRLAVLYAPSEKKFKLKIEDFSDSACHSNKVLSDIINKGGDIDLALMFVLSHGFNQAELLALTYENIDFDNKTIIVNKISNKGKIEKYRRKHRIRKLNIPTTLFEKISKTQKGIIFNLSYDEINKKILELGNYFSLNSLTYEDFQNAHVRISIENKVPLNLISQNMGFYDINEFLKKYQTFLPHENPNNVFDVLNCIMSS